MLKWKKECDVEVEQLDKLHAIRMAVEENKAKIARLQEYLDTHRREQITPEDAIRIEKEPIV